MGVSIKLNQAWVKDAIVCVRMVSLTRHHREFGASVGSITHRVAYFHGYLGQDYFYFRGCDLTDNVGLIIQGGDCSQGMDYSQRRQWSCWPHFHHCDGIVLKGDTQTKLNASPL